MGEHLKLAGSWATVRQENVEEMLNKVGAPFMVRKAAGRLKPSQTISFDGYNMKIISVTLKTEEKIIPLDGSEFSSELFSKTFVATASINEDGSIIVKGKVGDMDMMTVRKVDEAGQMVLTTTVGGVECCRAFVRK